MDAIKFYPMNRFPDYDGNETFSKTVLLYDETGEYADLGYYDFESSEWHIFGDFSFRLHCWCYIPSAKEFISNNDLEWVKHNGYC